MTEQKLFQNFRDQVLATQAPTRLQGYAQTIASHPQPSTASVQSVNSVKASHPVQVSHLDEGDWQNWHQPAPAPATAEQLERLQQWLRPLPTALIQLRQLLENQQMAINHLNSVSSKLTQLYQGELTAPTQHSKSTTNKMNFSWSAIADRCVAPLLSLILSVALLHVGLQPLNQKVDNLLNRLSQLEKPTGGHNGR